MLMLSLYTQNYTPYLLFVNILGKREFSSFSHAGKSNIHKVFYIFKLGIK